MTIQKCKPSFEQGFTDIKRAPFTQLYNKVIQNCTNMEAIAVWAYLQSQCDGWELCPHQLRKHFGVCKDKIYKILTYMICANLLIRHVQTSAKGTHIRTTYTVLDGTEFLEPQGIAQEFAPLPEKQDPVLQDPEKQDYIKERSLEKKENTKERSKRLSATDVAQAPNDESFDSFWKIYPVKKNKERAHKIWKRKKYGGLIEIILPDIMNRLNNCSQWADKQYIPHPSTYLTNELWNDELTLTAPKKSNTRTGDALSRVINKHLSTKGVTYDQYGNTIDPLR